MRKWRARRAKEADAIGDEQRFAEFLNRTKGSVPAGTELALFIKRKIPGDWRMVKSWHTKNQAPGVIWSNLPPRTKWVFRVFWEAKTQNRAHPSGTP